MDIISSHTTAGTGNIGIHTITKKQKKARLTIWFIHSNPFNFFLLVQFQLLQYEAVWTNAAYFTPSD